MCELPDYRTDPYAYELEERSRPDEMSMLTRTGEIVSALLDQAKNAAVLDLCCGTGLSLSRVIGHPSVSIIVGVDICINYLRFASARFASADVCPSLVMGDAVEVPLSGRRWHIIILASAYHHIEDERKENFLAGVAQLLGTNGRVVIAENLLPRYGDGALGTYADAVKLFYGEVLRSARDRNPDLPAHVAGLIRRVAQYGLDGEYEYKTTRCELVNHIRRAGLRIETEERVWPDAGELAELEGGNYVFTLRVENEGERS